MLNKISLETLHDGLRGLAYFQIDVRGTRSDLHSGSFGGAVANPNMVLAQILSQMKDKGGRIKIPGFYDDVKELREEERAEWKKLPFSETRAEDASPGNAISTSASPLLSRSDRLDSTLIRSDDSPCPPVTGVDSPQAANSRADASMAPPPRNRRMFPAPELILVFHGTLRATTPCVYSKNRPQAGRNYGWPKVTFGRSYEGREIWLATLTNGATGPAGTAQPKGGAKPPVPRRRPLHRLRAETRWRSAVAIRLRRFRLWPSKVQAIGSRSPAARARTWASSRGSRASACRPASA